MRTSGRFWALATLPVFLIGWAFVVGSIRLVVAAGGVCAWLLTHKYAFRNHVRRASEAVSVTQEISASDVVAGAVTSFELSVTMSAPVNTRLAVVPDQSVPTEPDVRSIRMEPRQEESTVVTDLTVPLLGRFEFGTPTVVVSDRLGLFEHRFGADSTAELRVTPERADDKRITAGGRRVAANPSESDITHTGSDPREYRTREYVPGDKIRTVDWKATARRGETHVREFTATTERTVNLFVDHRATMAGGTSTTKLDVARELAVAMVEQTRVRSDPLGCYTVGSDGITELFKPRVSLEHFERVSGHLDALTATEPETGSEDWTVPGWPDRIDERFGPQDGPDSARARTLRDRLTSDDSAMGRRLGPFFEQREAVVDTRSDQHLFTTVESERGGSRGTNWTTIVTDDSRRGELAEAVKVASRDSSRVLVFLLPTVLYEPGGLDGIDAGYDRYADYERYHSELTELENVSVIEVGPGDLLPEPLDDSYARKRTAGKP